MMPKLQKEPVEKRCVHVVEVNADAGETFDFRDIPDVRKLRGYGAADAFFIQILDKARPCWSFGGIVNPGQACSRRRRRVRSGFCRSLIDRSGT